MPSHEAALAENILLFDAQLTSITPKNLFDLYVALRNPKCAWVLGVIATLPTLWDAAASAIPKIQQSLSQGCIQEIQAWSQTGKLPDDSLLIDNSMLIPITIIMELVQYVPHLENDPLAAQHPPKKHAALGLCTGLLSAFAVSSSAKQADLEKYGAVAIRLAVLIGAVVDMQDKSDSEHTNLTSMSANWSSAEQKRAIDATVAKFLSVSNHEVSLVPECRWDAFWRR